MEISIDETMKNNYKAQGLTESHCTQPDLETIEFKSFHGILP